MVATQLVGRLDLDRAKLTEDLRVASGFRFSEAYSDYVCGGPWKSAMIWASGGDNGDGLVTNYDHNKAPSVTGHGEQLPYLRHLIETHFNSTHLNFARLAVIEDSVTFPHRDLLELKGVPEDARNSHRVHICLVTNDNCLFTEDNVVYRMRAGDVWFFDSARIHGAASLSREPRTHLILDFTEAGRDQIARFPLDTGGTIPEDRIVPREPVSESEIMSLVRLADLVSLDNFRDIASIVIKTHYRKDGGPDFVWSILERIARENADAKIREKILELHEFFVIDRSA